MHMMSGSMLSGCMQFSLAQLVCRVWRSGCQAGWQETWLQPVGTADTPQQQAWKEVVKPASNPLLLACLHAALQERQERAPQTSKPWLQSLVDYALGSSGQLLLPIVDLVAI